MTTGKKTIRRTPIEAAAYYAGMEAKAKKLKEAAICKARKQGITLQVLADATGLSTPGVLGIERRGLINE